MPEKRPVILYVDDDPDYRAVVRSILEANGYEAVEANSGEEGVEVFKSAKPDLIIVDLMMEEVDTGARFAKELRLLGNTAPIYMLSSVGEGMNMMEDPAALGLAGIFQKPVDHGVLVRTLKKTLRVE